MIATLRTSNASFSSSVASAAGAPKASLITRTAGNDENALPVVDMMTPSVATRSGAVAARICAIMPPIDAPTTCARLDTEVIQQCQTSPVMSSSVYGTGLCRPTR